MSDTQAAMREFRFLEEKRARGELSEPEGQRWYELRDLLGLAGQDPNYAIDPAAYAQQYGYYASDGNWYPYPLDEYGRPYDPNAGYAAPESYGYPAAGQGYPTDPVYPAGYAQPGYNANAHGFEQTHPGWTPATPAVGVVPEGWSANTYAPTPEPGPVSETDLANLGPAPGTTPPGVRPAWQDTQPSWPRGQVPTQVGLPTEQLWSPESPRDPAQESSDSRTQIWRPPGGRSPTPFDEPPASGPGDVTQVGRAPVAPEPELEPLIGDITRNAANPLPPEPEVIAADADVIPMEEAEPIPDEPAAPPLAAAIPRAPLSLDDFSSVDSLSSESSPPEPTQITAMPVAPAPAAAPQAGTSPAAFSSFELGGQSGAEPAPRSSVNGAAVIEPASAPELSAEAPTPPPSAPELSAEAPTPPPSALSAEVAAEPSLVPLPPPAAEAAPLPEAPAESDVAAEVAWNESPATEAALGLSAAVPLVEEPVATPLEASSVSFSSFEPQPLPSVNEAAVTEPEPRPTGNGFFTSFESDSEPPPSFDSEQPPELEITPTPLLTAKERPVSPSDSIWDAPAATPEPAPQVVGEAVVELAETDAESAAPPDTLPDDSDWGAVPEPELPVLDLAETDLSPSIPPPVRAEPSIVLAPDLQAEIEIEPMAQAINSEAFNIEMTEGAPELDGSPEDAVPLASANEFIVSEVGRPAVPRGSGAPRRESFPEAPFEPEPAPPPSAPPPGAATSSAEPAVLEPVDRGLFGAPQSFAEEDEVTHVDWAEPKPAPSAPAPVAARPAPVPPPASAVRPPPPAAPPAAMAPPPPPPPPAAPAPVEPEPPLEEIELVEEAVVEPPAQVASAFVTGEHRVIIHTMEGQVKRGIIRDVDLMDESIPLELQMGMAPERLATDRLKAIFFMQPAGARPPPASGQKIRVTFKDGRQVAGFSDDFSAPDRGFFVIPADQRTNTARIYIYRASIQGVAEG